MALTVGELVAYLRTDDKGWNLSRAQRSLKDAARDSDKLGSAMDAAAGKAFKAANSVAKIGTGVAAVSAVQGAVTGLSGVLGIIPGIAAAAAAAIATIKIGTSGMGKAIAGLGKSSGGGGGGGGGAEKAISDARRIADAERGVQRAQEQAQYAQESLTKAREDAGREIEDLQRRLRHQALDEESATLAVERARERLKKVKMTEGASKLDMSEAELGVRQAEQALIDTKQEYADLGVEAAAANRKGVEGSDQVIAAQRGVQDAARGVEDAQRNLAEAHQDAARGAAAAAAGAGAANEAFNKLSPNAKAVALAIHGMAGEWLKVKQATQDALFAGVASDLKTLGGLYLPVAKTGFAGIATEMNRGMRETAGFMAQANSVKDVAGIFGNVRTAIGNTADTAKPLTQIMLDITSVSSEFLPQLTNGFGGAAQKAADFVHNARETGKLKEWIQGGLDTLKRFGELFSNIGGIIGTVWTAFRNQNADALGSMIKLTGSVKDFLKSAEGQAALKALAQMIHTVSEVAGGVFMTVLKAVAQLLVVLSPAISALATSVGGALNSAIKMVTPWLMDMARFIQENADVIGPLIIGLYAGVKAFEAASAAMKIMNVIAAANPWVIIIAATVALVVLIVSKWDEITGAIGKAWEWISTKAGEVWGWIKRTIIDNITAAKTWIVDRFNDIVQFFKDLPGNVVKAIGNLGKTLYDKGKELVQGLIDGIKSMNQAVSDAIMGTTRYAKKGAIDGLKIGSPSKVFREYGMWTGMGLVVGIDSMTGKIAAAAAGMADAAMVDIPGPRLDPMPLGGGGAGGIGDPYGAANRSNTRPMVVIQPDGTAASAALLETLRESVRDQGGDVQVVLAG